MSYEFDSGIEQAIVILNDVIIASVQLIRQGTCDNFTK